MAWLFGWPQGPTLTEHMVAASAKGILVLVAAAALCFALRHASAAARHFVWTLAIGGLLALPVLSIGLPVWQIAILPSSPVEFASITTDAAQAAASTPNATFSPTGPEAVAARREPAAISIESKSFEPRTDTNAGQVFGSSAAPGWVRWTFVLWLAGALLTIGRLLIGTASIWWIARRADRITDGAWLAASKDIARQIKLTRRVRMFKTSRITMPVTCGLIRSAILLPADADDWPDERRQVVLVHELAHVKRWDCLTQMFAQIACSVYWFNPLVWLVTRQLRIERERACDDQVIHVGTKASEYAGHLLDMARTFRSTRCSSLAAVAIARRSELEGRLLAILDPGLKRRGLNRMVAVSAGVLISLMVLPLASVRLSAKTNASKSPVVEPTASSTGEPAYQAGVTKDSPGVNPEQRRSDGIGLPVLGETGAAESEPVLAGQESAGQDPAGTPASTPQKDNRAVVEALREAMKDEDPEVRQHALFALTQIGGTPAVGVLIEALRDQSWQVRAKAAYGLGLSGRQNGIDALVGALRDTSWQVREQAAWGLGLIADARAIEPLTNALTDESSDVREKAAWALGLKGDKRSVEPLMTALKDTDARVRGMAAWALGLKGDPRAASALKDVLKDPDKGVRQKAAWALGMLLMQRGEAFIGDPDPKGDNEIEFDREGKIQGIAGGVAGGVSGGVAGGVSSGSLGGVASGTSGGVSGGIAGGVSNSNGSGAGIGVSTGVVGGVAGGVRTSDGARITNPNSRPKTKSKPKQK